MFLEAFLLPQEQGGTSHWTCTSQVRPAPAGRCLYDTAICKCFQPKVTGIANQPGCLGPQWPLRYATKRKHENWWTTLGRICQKWGFSTHEFEGPRRFCKR